MSPVAEDAVSGVLQVVWSEVRQKRLGQRLQGFVCLAKGVGYSP